MNLDQYLSLPESPSVQQLRERMRKLGYPLKSDAQIRQWRHGYSGRRPDPGNCVALEKATNGAVTRRDLRPDDWHRIWPELAALAATVATEQIVAAEMPR